jgi:hypothetical protein
MVSKLLEIWSGLFIPDPDPDFFTHPGSATLVFNIVAMERKEMTIQNDKPARKELYINMEKNLPKR